MSDLNIPAVHKALHESKKPFPFVVDLVELPEFLYLMVYADEILAFDDSEREQVMVWLLAVRDKIQNLGIRCEIVGTDDKLPKR